MFLAFVMRNLLMIVAITAAASGYGFRYLQDRYTPEPSAPAATKPATTAVGAAVTPVAVDRLKELEATIAGFRAQLEGLRSQQTAEHPTAAAVGQAASGKPGGPPTPAVANEGVFN